MGLTRQHLQTRLTRFEFEALVLQDLGWKKVDAAKLQGVITEVSPPLTWRLLAEAYESRGCLIVTGSLRGATQPQTFYRWLDQFIPLYSDPLVVWVDPDGQRSLWCWLGGNAEQPYWRTRCIVKEQGDQDWAARLLALKGDQLPPGVRLADYLSPFTTVSAPELMAGFQHSWETLVQALKAIPLVSERQHYAMMLLCRLIAMAQLQRRGYLGGDEWYLHNQFGQSQQRGADQFFQTVLQPLFQQGLTLPLEDRLRPIIQKFGALPFLPASPFSLNELDQRWAHLPLADAAFEPALTWLGDWLLATDPPPLHLLLAIAEQLVNGHREGALATPEPILNTLCDRTLNATLLDWGTGVTGRSYRSIEHLLMAITPEQAGELLKQLGQLTILDPACGSGRFLVAALQHLIYVGQVLKGIAALGQPRNMPIWAQGSTRARATATTAKGTNTLIFCRHLLTHCLYGLDLWPPAVELTRLQLFLQAVEHTTETQELAGLPDLTLTILQGNGLLGLVQVEAERFDQVQPKGRKPAKATPDINESTLQGNLLQPLLADTYQGVLAERQVRLEHYRSQTQLLAESGTVPTYAQADFLRDRLQELNQIAQEKLTHLLWSECSQQLGIRIQYQDAAGHRQSRLLEVTDLELLEPFHWGFYFHQLLRDRGGFDVVLSHFPGGTVQPSEAEFVELYQDLLEQKQVAPSTFLHNRKQVLTIDVDLRRAWSDYRGQFSLPNQYFRRSDQYPHTGQPTLARSQGRLYWSRLWLERAVQLLRPGGRCGLVLDPFWGQASSASLRHWLQEHTHLEGVIDLANHHQLWPELPSRSVLSLVWLKRQGKTPGYPYRAYNRVASSLSVDALGHLLQRLINLAEETW
jgi:hypothetical protein